MTDVLKSAVQFMRDNTSGDLVVKAVLRKDGAIRYKMQEGHSYLLDRAQLDILDRYEFTPRFAKEAEDRTR